MSSHKRKRIREASVDFQASYQAEQEAQAISSAFSSRTIDFGKRMNKYYWCDGQKFQTGKKHRRQAMGMTAFDRRAKVRRKHQSRQVNLQSLGVHKRINNPELYKTIDIRRIQHLLEYKTGQVRPIGS